MKFGSVCSGIEAASVAWHPLGWQAAWFAEIEPFPSAVLAHHYPDTPNLGDMTTIARRVLTGEVEAPDMLCGGTPCQAFSVAGLRESLSDDRGSLTLKFVELADAIDHVRVRAGKPAAVVFWENVPGVLSTKDNAFGCFLAGLAGEDDPLQPPGGKWSNAGAVYGPQRAIAWRTLDAQYFGVAQRRRRVFVVASARNDFDPAEVLFEWDGVRRDSAPSRQAGKGAARGVEIGPSGGDFTELNPTLDTRAKDGPIRNQLAGAVLQPVPELAACLTRGTGLRYDTDTDTILPVGVTIHGTDPTVRKVASYDDVAQCLRARTPGNIDNSSTTVVQQPVAFDTTQITSKANYSNPQPGEACHPLAAGAHAPAIAFPANLSGTQHASTENLAPAMGAKNPTAVAFHENQRAELTLNETAGTVKCAGGKPGQGYPAVLTAMQVRRLTPVECERLQGFGDNYTRIPWRGKPADQCPDGPRYKALGNSWAVPNVRWLGGRIDAALKRSAA